MGTIRLVKRVGWFGFSSLLTSAFILALLAFAVRPAAAAGFAQQGAKLIGSNAVGFAAQGVSVAISANGNTAIVGGLFDNVGAGAAWVFTRSNGVWTQQGPKLVGTGAIGAAMQGASAALSADGNTAVIGGYGDNSDAGAAWVFTRSNGVWTQQGPKLVGSGATGAANQGQSVGISADGNTVIVGGGGDDSGAGAVWVFTRSGGTWSQQGDKLVGSGATGAAGQGQSVGISADGNTAIVGGIGDNGNVGAAWVFTRSGGTWGQQGGKLVGSGASGAAAQGYSVAIAADGDSAILGGIGDSGGAGAAWVFTRNNGVWTQQGAKLVGSGATGAANQGYSIAMSANGNTAVVGGIGDSAAWVFTRRGGTWSQQGDKLVGSNAVGPAAQGSSVAISANGSTAIVGGASDNSLTGAVWPFYWPPVAHDFDGDHTSDVLWHDTVGSVATWQMAGTTIARSSWLYDADPAWQIAGTSSLVQSTGDFDNDGEADVLWRRTDGDLGIWLIDGTTTKAQIELGLVDTAWQIAGVGDFDGDGIADILWRHTGGDVAIWEMNGTTPKLAVDIGNVPNAWQIAGVGDFDGDGKADILWRHSGGDVSIWEMNGVTPKLSVDIGNVPTAWQIAGVADFDGDGKSDFLWRQSGGDVAVWLMNGITPTSEVDIGNVPTAWQIVSAGDYDGDGKGDILWRHAGGDVSVWEMNGTTPKSAVDVGNVQAAWTIVE